MDRMGPLTSGLSPSDTGQFSSIQIDNLPSIRVCHGFRKNKRKAGMITKKGIRKNNNIMKKNDHRKFLQSKNESVHFYYKLYKPHVSDYVKLMSWCRCRGAHNWTGGTIGEREREWGGKGEGGGQYTSNLGPEWTVIAPHAKEGFQVSKRDSGTGKGPSRQRGIIKGIVKGYQRDCQGVIKGIVPCASGINQSCTYCANVCMSC